MTGQVRERLPMPELELLTQAQTKAIEQITSGPRGALIGPFVPLLRSPELMSRLQLVGEYLRFASELEDDLLELTILVVARHWDQQFEWGHHQPIAIAKGVPIAVIDDVEQHRRPVSGRPEYRLVWDLVHGLLNEGGIDDALFAGAVGSLGEQSVIELVVAVGYYTTLALTMNLAGTPSPAEAPRLRHVEAPS